MNIPLDPPYLQRLSQDSELIGKQFEVVPFTEKDGDILARTEGQLAVGICHSLFTYERRIVLRPLVSLNHMWDLKEAQAFMSWLQPIALEAGWNAHIGGSVITQGWSDNDLDILLMPCYQTDRHCKEDIICALVTIGCVTTGFYELPRRYCYTLDKITTSTQERKRRTIEIIFYT